MAKKFFDTALKGQFYGDGDNVLTSTSRVCLLDANGNPIGSDTIERVSSLLYTKDDLVDMGLPSGTLWATKNLGATAVTGYGWYFSWGNLEAHPEGSGYNFNQTTYDATPAASISADLTLSQDAARANLGGAWRMPTKDDFVELFNDSYTTNEWTSNYENSGVAGRVVTSKANGNKVFFPAGGRYSGTTLADKGTVGRYWSSKYLSSAGARFLKIDSNSAVPDGQNARYLGFSIRPVQ